MTPIRLFTVVLALAVCTSVHVRRSWGVTTTSGTGRPSSAEPGKATVIAFGASWCVPCARMHPVLTAIATDTAFSGKIVIRDVDIDSNGDLAALYKIRSIPVLIFLDKNGREIKRHFGTIERDDLARMLKTLFKLP